MSRLQNTKVDVVVIGAGVAGLTALSELDRAGVKAICLEARDRIGGRILTTRDPLSPIPIELGAEFIHGRPPETWNIIDSAALTAYDCTEHAVHIKRGQVTDSSDAWLPVDEVMDDMRKTADSGPDQAFAKFLKQTPHAAEAKNLATSYVEGFNAAAADVIGITSLARDARAADSIDGDRSFRMLNGYDAIPACLLRRVDNFNATLRLNSVVEKIEWRKGSTRLFVRSALIGEVHPMESRRVIITVPLGVLQAEPGVAGAIHFDPLPSAILEAARRLRFGQVFRVVLRFRDRIWELHPELAEAGFLLSDEPIFPTWWTPLPLRVPLITGWSAGPKGDALLGCDRKTIVTKAIEQLSHITAIDRGTLQFSLQAAYFHDWHQDPFSRGAYSYVPAGALGDQETLAQPVEGTLYFAGEATETNGHSATVHGAIMSGKRAAEQVLQSGL